MRRPAAGVERSVQRIGARAAADRSPPSRAVDAAQEEVQRAAQVLRRVVGRAQARAQQAVQGQQVERGLHVVAVRSHGRLQRRAV
jgi:hypothetical protein